MKDVQTVDNPGRFAMRRSRGAASGLLLVALGLWGAFMPFIGPYFNFAFDSAPAWTWTNARGWLEVLPGIAAVLGGLLLLTSRNRATAMLGGWITVLAGGWFVVGRLFAGPWNLGDIGAPVATTLAGQLARELAFFSGLGAVIIFLGALALGRVSVRSIRDLEYARRPVVTDRVPDTYEPAPVASAVADRDGVARDARDREALVARYVRDREVVVARDEPQLPPRRRHLNLRGMFGGSHRTPIKH